MADDTLADPRSTSSGESDGERPPRAIREDGGRDPDDRGGRGPDDRGGRDPDDRGARTLEAIFRTMTSRRRRHILYELRATEVSDVETLATAAAAAERGVSRDAVTDEERDRMRTQVVHADVPLLEEAGCVEYDARSETVRYANPPAALDPLLGICAEIDGETESSR
ncbi:hypothetical protein [Halovivax sp.]|uniref:DUF7344 domain-containing protein n=1 Tax=Halovivax sp. TaxID=1935978 RepID=UPI0025C22389|nr:hypothetical protein [Halovivax sp.]